jgi:hypothetical protein
MTREEFNVLAVTWPSCDYYDCDDDREQLSHSTVTEALEEALDLVPDADGTEAQLRRLWPESLTVYGWTRKTIDLCGLTERAMEAISDEWAEEYSNPDVDTVKLPPKLGDLIEAAVRTAFEGHPVWSCEQTDEIEIPIDQLVEIARLEWPEWFEVKP